MHWSWREYLETPGCVVKRLVEKLVSEHDKREQDRAMRALKGRR